MLTAKGFVCIFFCCSESFFVVLRCFVPRCCFPCGSFVFYRVCFRLHGCRLLLCCLDLHFRFYVGYIISSSGSLFQLYSVASSSSPVVAFCYVLLVFNALRYFCDNSQHSLLTLECLLYVAVISHKQILVDLLDAKTANVEKLVAKNFSVNAKGSFHVETTKADLAYHLTLKEPDKYCDLEEGDIVGFYKDEESGETYIQRLRSNNVHTALHAGVVSRSHWLAGHKPLNSGRIIKLRRFSLKSSITIMHSFISSNCMLRYILFP